MATGVSDLTELPCVLCLQRDPAHPWLRRPVGTPPPIATSRMATLDLSGGLPQASHAARSAESRPLTCFVCQAKFNFRDGLRQHMRSHSKSPAHRCESCNCGGTGLVEIQHHVTPRPPERPLNCGGCNATYTSTEQLRRHQALNCRVFQPNF